MAYSTTGLAAYLVSYLLSVTKLFPGNQNVFAGFQCLCSIRFDGNTRKEPGLLLGMYGGDLDGVIMQQYA